MKHLVILIVAASCTADVPATPSFQQHVMPILAANCIRCHGDPTLGGAPTYFRLDVYDDLVVREGRPRDPETEGQCGLEPADAEAVVCGAATMAQLLAVRVADDERPMPPRFSIEGHQVETLERWADGAGRGDPRPRNAVPTVTVESQERSSTIVSLRVVTADRDHDLVVGQLRADLPGGSRLVGIVRSGRVEIAWDAAGSPPGSYPLSARVDDGAMLHDVVVGQLEIGAP